jgi:hypothetical protein
MPNVALLGLRARALALPALAALACTLPACGGSEPAPVAPPPVASAAPAPTDTGSAAAAPAAPPATPTQEEAHKLLMRAASCWFGGVWADAMGEQDDVKKAAIETRCKDLEQRVWQADDKVHLEQLRALEQNATSDVVAAVDLATKNDAVDGPRRDALVKLTQALADAVKETMLARRAGDRVKRDLDHEPDKLNADETASVAPLRAHAKLEALLKLDAGDLSKEANALGLLCALDRVEVARGLPKHLKLYAAGDAFQVVFGVTMPDVPQDATQKLVPGTWLKFLSDTAAAAGHAVPATAKTPREKDALAWAGMQQGFGEKLAADAAGIGTATDLSKVVTMTLHRLETEYSAQQAAAATEKPKGKKNK